MNIPVFRDEDAPDATDAQPSRVFDDGDFHGRTYLIRPLRFGERHRDWITASQRVRLLHHGNVVEVATDASGRTATHLRVGALDGASGRVRARAYVIAAGGIENARLLLASNARRAAGVGNEHDQVGRYFMEHCVTHRGAGPLVVWPEVPTDAYRVRFLRRTFLHASRAFARSEGMLSTAMLLRAPSPKLAQKLGASELDLRLDAFDAAVARSSHRIDHLHEPVAAAPPQPQILRTVYVCEQQPNPESRITLSEERDALGMPRAHLDWKLSGLELESIRRFARRLSQKVAARSQGRLRHPLPDDALLRVMGVGHHHMGTTRMHADASRGVVDADCRVHGVDNLYVAGSSVFPTVGAANPTFTIVALAIRLADHLRQRLGTR